jgi:site-specific DNA-methyltransferase (adenine-specific)
MPDNVLYYGDNLDVLRQHVRDESIDLVYLDPPFNSNASYNVLFSEQSGERSAAQIRAFEDSWRWDQAAAAAYQETVEAGGDVSSAMQAFRTLLGDSNMLAYLAMMAPRLVELRRVLKRSGSLYLHCDPTASHYLKLLLDALLEPDSFRNEITWKRTSGRKARWQFGRVHDTILFYTRSAKATWNPPTVPQTADTVRGHDLLHESDGTVFRLSDLTAAETRRGDTVCPGGISM